MAIETHTIIVEARGEAEVARLSQKVDQQKAVLRGLIEQQAAARASGRDLSQAMTDSAGRIEALTRTLNQAKSSLDAFRSSQIATSQSALLARADAIAMQEITARGPRGPMQPFGIPAGSLPPVPGIGGLGVTKGGVADLSQTFATLSYTINDADQFNVSFTAGIRALGNQIPGLIIGMQQLKIAGFAGIGAALMGPQGLILGMTLLATLTPQIAAHWGDLQAAMGIGLPQPALDGPELLARNLKKATDEMEALREKSRLTLAELLKLQELERSVPELQRRQREERETDELLGVGSRPAGERGEGVRSAIGEVGGDAALAALTHALSRLEDERGRVSNPMGGTGTAVEVARALLLEASRGDRFARDQVRSAVGETSTFGAALGQFSPETKAAEEVADRIDRVSETLSKALGTARETIAKRAEELAEEDLALSRAIQQVEAHDRKAAEKAAADEDQGELRRARVTGVEGLARTAALGGLSAADIATYLQTQLGYGARAATDIGIGSWESAQEEMARREMEGPPRRMSEITGDLHADIQRGVGGDDIPGKQLRVAEQMRDALFGMRQDARLDAHGRIIIKRKHF